VQCVNMAEGRDSDGLLSEWCEIAGWLKCEKFLDCLRNFQLLKNDCAPWIE